MKWFIELFSGTLGRKLIMAITGVFLILFLIVHLIGNFQLLKDDAGIAFNNYAAFMTHNPIIKTISYTLYASILIHVLWSIILTIFNSKARGGESYKVTKTSALWSSRNMGILGTLILIFIVIHLKDFWAEMHWGNIPTQDYDGHEVKDLYSLVALAFSQLWYVILYVFCMIALSFHLLHGFTSAFQTLGINQSKYNSLIKVVGLCFAIVVPALYALIPIWMFLF